jgi:hypothetical protein
MFGIYTSSIYFVVTTITTIGYGDYQIENNIERIFGSICMFGGCALYGYIQVALMGIVQISL